MCTIKVHFIFIVQIILMCWIINCWFLLQKILEFPCVL